MNAPPYPSTTDDTLAEIARDAELRALLTEIVARYPTYDHYDVMLMERARAVLDRLKRREQ